MANYNNIKKYAEFSHKVAPHGGPEEYVKKVAEVSEKLGREKGYQQGIKTGFSRGVGTTLLGLAILGLSCFGGKKIYDKVKESHESKQRDLSTELEKVEQEAIHKIEETISDEEVDSEDKEEGMFGLFGDEKK